MIARLFSEEHNIMMIFDAKTYYFSLWEPITWFLNDQNTSNLWGVDQPGVHNT